MDKKHLSTRTIAYTAIMTAMVAVATMVLKIQTADSYTNLGDAMIFVTGILFGPIPATIAGGFGSFIADVITYPLTMWFTLIIKALEGLIIGIASNIAKHYIVGQSKRIWRILVYVLGMILAAGWMVLGYYLAKAFMYGTKESALLSLPKNLIQGGISIILAIVLTGIIYPAIRPLIEIKTKPNDIDDLEN